MSKTNREKEYNRLIKLGREKDICQSLIDEFGLPPSMKAEKPKDKKEKNKGNK